MIGVICHDSGGATLVKSFLDFYKLDYIYSASGPAVKIFGGPGMNIKSCIDSSIWVLTGTSSISRIEMKAVQYSKSQGKFVATYIDHWNGYLRRFILKNRLVFPDEIWVEDIYAYKRALEEGLSAKILIEGNKELISHKNASYHLQSVESKLNILFLGEPIRDSGKYLFDNANHWKTSEEECFMRFLNYFKGRINYLIIRPHPKESEEKYIKILRNQKSIERFSVSNKDFYKDLEKIDLVVGISSKALVKAYHYGKPVYSALPKEATYPKLPFEYIKYF